MPPGLIIAIVASGLAVLYITVTVGFATDRTRGGSTRRLAGLQGDRDVMEESLLDRVVIPAMQRLGRFGMRFTPQEWAARTRRRLIRAGFYPEIDETSWAAVRVLAMLVATLAYFVLSPLVGDGARLLLLVFLAVGGYAGPDQVLNRQVASRVNAIERDLPDIIDLLVISIEAGLGFEAALDRVVSHVPGDLSDEFSRMLQETRVGVSRQDAMRSLAVRTDVDDLNSFILAMNQADTFGVSVGRMLRVQADEMRIRRRQRAQEKAFAAPVKMVFPLVLCVFPAIFVILLGPAAINILANLGS